MSRFWGLTLFILCGIFFEQIATNCSDKLNRCNKNFLDEIATVKYHSAEKDPLGIYESVCSSNGIYTRLVNCIKSLSGHCELTPKSHDIICMTRRIKMSTYRYTWRSNIIHDICYQTQADGLLDDNFFKYEKCISKVLNKSKWKCDEHFKMSKTTSGAERCKHWNDFRGCSKSEVDLQCGQKAADVSDFLFTVHGNYFSTYAGCTATKTMNNTECWYDSILERVTTASPQTKPEVVPSKINTTLPMNEENDQTTATSANSSNITKDNKEESLLSKKSKVQNGNVEEVPVNDDSHEQTRQDVARQHDIRSAIHEQFQQDSKSQNNSNDHFSAHNLKWIIGMFIFVLFNMI